MQLFKGGAVGATRRCASCCKADKLACPVPAVAVDDGDDGAAGEDDEATRFDVSGFALWLDGLASLTEQAGAVRIAFERAAAASLTERALILSHGYSILELYVAPVRFVPLFTPAA